MKVGDTVALLPEILNTYIANGSPPKDCIATIIHVKDDVVTVSNSLIEDNIYFYQDHLVVINDKKLPTFEL